MADWPRTLLPRRNTDFDVPGPFISKAQSGRVNTRSTNQAGRTWTEEYLLKVSDVTAKAFLAKVRQIWRDGEIFTIDHRDYLAPNGDGGGTPVVASASQTGSSLVISGATASTADWLMVGDIFSIAGVNTVYETIADVSVAASGTATITLSPPIVNAPASLAALTVSAVKVRAVILEPPDMPETGPDDFGVLTVKFSEAP